MAEIINAPPLCQALYNRNIVIICWKLLQEVADQMIIDEPTVLSKTIMVGICR